MPSAHDAGFDLHGSSNPRPIRTPSRDPEALACAIQSSLGSGANEVFAFGEFEAAVVHFHRELDAALAS
jgi:hypothetical protein